jgi:NosR/NirI family transcriptional regulator, nitrous oxide reductase regulator
MHMTKTATPAVRRIGVVLCILLAALFATGAAAQPPRYEQLADLFPQADRLGDFEGEPRSAPVYRGDQLLGYVFETDDVAPIPAYSGKPVNHLVGLDLAGTITGAFVLEHHEPILLAGIPESALHRFAEQYAGKRVGDRVKIGAGKREGYVNVDAITGATVTVMVMNEAIMRSAHRIAVARAIIEPAGAAEAAPATVRDEYHPADWTTLTGNGSVRRLLLTRGEVDDAFIGTEAEGVSTAPPEAREEPFIDLYYAYLNAPTIGINLLGERQYSWMLADIAPGDHLIGVMASGMFSFRGSGFVRGGIFDRIQVVQDDEATPFRDSDYYRLTDVYAEGMPRFSEMAVFVVRAERGFDPGRPWMLELLVPRATGPLTSIFTGFAGEYAIPEEYIERPAPVAVAEPAELEAVWVMVWRERTFQITVLLSSLGFLTLLLLTQDWLVRRPRLLAYVRNAFLLYTLFFIGWYTLAQLSVVNVLTFTNSLIRDFRWETFLIDPMLFILWTFVAVSLLLWGRGVYCGWLCPFGALQELTNKVARALKVRQVELPAVVHERLWALKYVILLALFGLSLHSIALAERYAEVEPFKTAIVLHFQREWAYVFYALVLVALSAVNQKFFCKYLCPLGAALAFGGRLRMFGWLRRRKECGKPCQVCANECGVQAITRTGEINVNECHYCLDCQVTYYDEHKCPPLVERRKRRERGPAAREAARRMEEQLTPHALPELAPDLAVTVEKS